MIHLPQHNMYLKVYKKAKNVILYIYIFEFIMIKKCQKFVIKKNTETRTGHFFIGKIFNDTILSLGSVWCLLRSVNCFSVCRFLQ